MLLNKEYYKTKFYKATLLKIIYSAIFCLLWVNTHATIYYVSNSGNDTNTGTSPGNSWKSLEKVNGFAPTAGDQILFKRGDSWSGTINVNASGSEGKPITYGAYGEGEKPKIYGSKVINGWVKHSGNIYKATVDAKKINQLFVNGKKLSSARHPNSGYLKITSLNSHNSFASNQLSSDINYTGAVAIIRVKEWALATKNVTNAVGKSVTIDSKPVYDLKIGEGFVFFNKLDFLDRAGEWYFDKQNKTLYAWLPGSEQPVDNQIKASVGGVIINILSKNYVTIRGLQLIHANTNGIEIDNSGFIKIEQNDIIHPDSRGLEVNISSSRYIVFSGNTINGANHDGIHARGTNHTFENNTIKNIRLFDNIGVSGTGDAMGGRGISIVGANSVIKNNRIENIGYNGIGFLSAPHTLIENNVIKNVCLTTEDGGGIYCFNTSENDPGCEYSIIRGNIIDNSPGNGEGYIADIRQGAGIYMDDRIHHITIENNTIARCSYNGIYLHNTKYVTVKNNTLFDNGAGFRVTEKYNATGNIVKNNIVVNIASTKYSGDEAMMVLFNSDKSNIVTIDENVYVDRHRSKPFRDAKDYSENSFLQWKLKTGHDIKSVIIDTKLLSTEDENLIYNPTTQAISLNLGNNNYNDIHGNALSGILILQPFGSVIVVGKNIDEINQKPIIKNQSFNLYTPSKSGQRIGIIKAVDFDPHQTLSFRVIDDIPSYFSIDRQSGVISITEAINSPISQTINFRIIVSDNATNSLADTATLRIRLRPSIDEEPPVITSFKIPGKSNNLKVPIFELFATDNYQVTGYSVADSPEIPAKNNWKKDPQEFFFFSNKGTKLLYAWAIDSSGNVSNPSIASVDIIIPDTFVIERHINICEGENFNGWNENGIYEELNFINQDSIQKIFFHINVNTSNFTEETVVIKDDEEYFGWNENGIYNRTLTNVHECDSVVQTTLTVLPTIYTSEEIHICEGDSYNGWIEPGEYTRTLNSSSGADSIIHTQLWVNPVYHLVENVIIFEGENYNGWTTSGTYSTDYLTVAGCDSTVIINLSVEKEIEEDLYSYRQWSREGRFKRTGTTNEENVNEANRLKNNSIEANKILVYPNPFQSFLFIQFPDDNFKNQEVQVYENAGKLIHSFSTEFPKSGFDFGNLPSGIYYLHFKNADSKLVKKIVKK